MATTATTYSVRASLTDAVYNHVYETTKTGITPSAYGKYEARVASNATEVETAIPAGITGGNGPGWSYFKNLDDTASIQIGVATGVYTLTLAPGEACVLPIDSAATSIFHHCPTAAAPVLHMVIHER